MTLDFQHELIALLPRLRRFGVSLTRDRDRADDLVQWACERAWRARDQWEPGTRLDAWMFRIMRNLWIDDRRSQRHGEATSPLEDDAPIAGEDGVTTTELRSEMNAVERAIARLPEEFRSVLVLVCLDGLAYREAAEVLDIPIGTVMSRLARARVAIATDLGLKPGDRAFDAGE